jgi:4-hydroxy-tetrahydrodipicolinate reductase
MAKLKMLRAAKAKKPAAAKRIRVLLYGCGVMGQKIARAMLAKKSFEIAGAVDINPKVAGKDLGELLDGSALGIRIESDIPAALRRAKAQAAIVATTSHLEGVAEQVRPLLKAGLHVVSTCEELSYPWLRKPAPAKKLDAEAKKAGVVVVGTGINPGYLMDTLPLMLTAPCARVDSVHVTRVLDSTKRRIPFQQKVGTNLTVEEFRAKIDSGAITGHVGLRESAAMICAGLGWTADAIEEKPPAPVVAEVAVRTGLGEVPRGKVIGLRSACEATREGRVLVRLDFTAHAGVPEEYDEVRITGEPGLHQKILGGVNGDIGTVSVTLNTIPRALTAPPGLRLMSDLAVPSCTP